ncbi:MAG: alpha/beta hydrolase-fold protein [Bacteroidota bacterium]
MKKCILLTSIIVAFFFCSKAQQTIRLYEGKAPGSESWNWTEKQNNKNSFNTEVVYNVSDPTITAFLPPPSLATGTAIVIAPGGAFHTLSINSEGNDVAKWLNARGVAAFVLRYRVVKSETDDPVKELMSKMGDFKKLDAENATVVPLAIADGKKAIEYVRTHAKEYNINPKQIGIMGFSAGGTVTMGVGYSYSPENRPDFIAPIYAYLGALENKIVRADAPPAFVVVASDDQLGLAPHSIQIYTDWLAAKKSVELHAYLKGGHGFGMRKQNIPTDSWIDRFGDWMKQQGYLDVPAPSTPPSPFQRTPTPNDTLQSVKVLADGRVKFSIYAPKASEVTISGDFAKVFGPQKLVKDDIGVWSTLSDGALKPDIYTYDFTVDGVKTFDPKNAMYKESLSGFSNIMEVKGPENDFQTLKDVPHGKVEIVNYKSTALGGIMRRMHVYLPPNYDAIVKKEKLPVLYLLHGGGDNDAAWTTAGRANLILDNLYAEGKLKPMIVVMPSGHTPMKGLAMGAGPAQDPFCNDLLTDIMPFIAKNYPVSTKRENSAIAGLSMGGVQTLNIALWNPEKFGYVYPMSTGYFPPVIKEMEEKYAPILKNPALNQFKLFTIGMGKDDPLAYKNNKAMMEMFDKQGIKYKYEETDGGHTFLVWRKNLAFITPQLFR